MFFMFFIWLFLVLLYKVLLGTSMAEWLRHHALNHAGSQLQSVWVQVLLAPTWHYVTKLARLLEEGWWFLKRYFVTGSFPHQ